MHPKNNTVNPSHLGIKSSASAARISAVNEDTLKQLDRQTRDGIGLAPNAVNSLSEGNTDSIQ